MQSAGELQNRADFDILVNNNFAKIIKNMSCYYLL